MLHLCHGASPSELIWNWFVCNVLTVVLLCSLPSVTSYEAQGEWLHGGAMERVNCCHQCYSSTLHQLLKFGMLSRCQPKTSCGINELLWGRQSTLTYFVVYSSVMERIRYVLCIWNTVEIYRSNIVWTQQIYCAFADWLLHAYLVEMQAVGFKTGGR